MMDNPEQHFNFGLTYSDFKSYLLKLVYCRSIRKFVEQKRLERILEFQKANSDLSFAFHREEEPHQ